jgi:hypothetical protein
MQLRISEGGKAGYPKLIVVRCLCCMKIERCQADAGFTRCKWRRIVLPIEDRLIIFGNSITVSKKYLLFLIISIAALLYFAMVAFVLFRDAPSED